MRGVRAATVCLVASPVPPGRMLTSGPAPETQLEARAVGAGAPRTMLGTAVRPGDTVLFCERWF